MIVVVMGVTGAGKTTVGRALAKALHLPFQDADDWHPPANRAKLQCGLPLNDADRWPWLADLSQAIRQWEVGGGAVLACSALKKAYRDALTRHAPGARFVYLEGTSDAITERLRRRAAEGHPLVTGFEAILAGQFADLEPPEGAILVPVALSPDKAVEWIVEKLS
ncbi:MAG: gluconokinase, GntK/IdnK-type [Sumerlaeia bacterium]